MAHACVLSLNLHGWKLDGELRHGPGDALERQRAKFACIARVAAGEGVVAIAVQEACAPPLQPPLPHWPHAVDLLADALTAATGERWAHFWTAAHRAWDGEPDACEEGVAVLVRASRAVVAGPHATVYAAQGPLRRAGASVAVAVAPGIALAVHCVHLEAFDGQSRAAQGREAAADALAAAGELWSRDYRVAPLVLGDMNDDAGSPVCAAIASFGFVDVDPRLFGIDRAFLHCSSPCAVVSAFHVFNGMGPIVSDHPGLIVRLALPGSAPARPLAHTANALCITAQCDVGYGHALFIRGSQEPLTWNRGLPLRNCGAREWRAVLWGLPGVRVEFKLLVDDCRWQTGANCTASFGQTASIAPTFET